MVLDHLKIQNVAFDAFVSERNNLDSHGFILLFMEMRCHTCPPLYITHIYISVMTHHYCVEVWNLELSSALKLTFVQFQACSVLHEAGTAWMYVFVGAIRYQARQSTDASIMPRIKPLAMSFHHQHHCLTVEGGFQKILLAFTEQVHPHEPWIIPSPELNFWKWHEMTGRKKPLSLLEMLRTCHGGFSCQRAEGETTSTKKMCRHAACMDFLRIGIARIVEETAFCKCVSDVKWISSILYLYGCRPKGPWLECSIRWPFVCQNDLWRKPKSWIC